MYKYMHFWTSPNLLHDHQAKLTSRVAAKKLRLGTQAVFPVVLQQRLLFCIVKSECTSSELASSDAKCGHETIAQGRGWVDRNQCSHCTLSGNLLSKFNQRPKHGIVDHAPLHITSRRGCGLGMAKQSLADLDTPPTTDRTHFPEQDRAQVYSWQ